MAKNNLQSIINSTPGKATGTQSVGTPKVTNVQGVINSTPGSTSNKYSSTDPKQNTVNQVLNTVSTLKGDLKKYSNPVQTVINKTKGKKTGVQSVGTPTTTSKKKTTASKKVTTAPTYSYSSFSGSSSSAPAAASSSKSATGNTAASRGQASASTTAAESITQGSGGSSGGASGGSGEEEIVPDGNAALAAQFAAREGTTAGNTTSSDGTIVDKEGAASTFVDSSKVKSPTRDALTLLDNELKRLAETLKSDKGAINAESETAKNNLQAKQGAETGAQSMSIANMGGYLGGSGSGQAVMVALTQSHRAELQDLDAKRQRALAEADQASANRRWDIVREKADEIARLDQETYAREEVYNARVREEATKDEAEAQNLKDQNSIFSSIKAGSKTPEDIFEDLKGAMPIEKINKFLDGIVKDSSGTGFKFTAANNANLLGSGMSMDDIGALNEYVSENGYDETVRGALTPAQRTAADKIFRGTKLGAGGTGGYTPQENRKLEQAGLLGASRQEQLDYLYSSDSGEDVEFESPYTSQIINGEATLESLPFELQEDVRAELLAYGLASDVVPEWYMEYIQTEEFQTPTPDTLKTSWSKYRKSALGETEDAGTDKPWWNLFD